MTCSQLLRLEPNLTNKTTTMDHPTPNDPNSKLASFPASRPHPHVPAVDDNRMNLNFPLIATAAAVSVMLVMIIVLCTQAWFMEEVRLERQDSRKRTINHDLVDLQTKQYSNIDSYRWLDSDHKRVALPIERAMELTVAKYQQKARSSSQGK